MWSSSTTPPPMHGLLLLLSLQRHIYHYRSSPPPLPLPHCHRPPPASTWPRSYRPVPRLSLSPPLHFFFLRQDLSFEITWWGATSSTPTPTHVAPPLTHHHAPSSLFIILFRGMNVLTPTNHAPTHTHAQPLHPPQPRRHAPAATSVHLFCSSSIIVHPPPPHQAASLIFTTGVQGDDDSDAVTESCCHPHQDPHPHSLDFCTHTHTHTNHTHRHSRASRCHVWSTPAVMCSCHLVLPFPLAILVICRSSSTTDFPGLPPPSAGRRRRLRAVSSIVFFMSSVPAACPPLPARARPPAPARPTA